MTSPARVHAGRPARPARATLNAFVATVRYQLAEALTARRWLLAVPALLVAAWVQSSSLSYDDALRARSDVIATDLPRYAMTSAPYLFLVLGLGFLLLTADTLTRALDRGGLPQVLTRTRSRGTWWAGVLTAMAVTALGYVLLAQATLLTVGALRFPLTSQRHSLGTSAYDPTWMPMPAHPGTPAALTAAAVISSTTALLWLLSTVALLCTLLAPRSVLVLLPAPVWLVADFLRAESLFRDGPPTSLDPLAWFNHAVYADAYRDGTVVLAGRDPLTGAIVIGAAVIAVAAASTLFATHRDTPTL